MELSGIKYFSNIGVSEFLVEAAEVSVGDKLLVTGPTTGALFMTLDEARSRYAKSLAISLSEEQINPSFIKKLKEMLEPVSGGTLPINVYYQSAKGRALLRLGIQWSITPTDDILTELVNLLGENAVELEFG